MLRDYRIAKPLSSTHEKINPGSATPRQLPPCLTCCVPQSHGSYAAYDKGRRILRCCEITGSQNHLALLMTSFLLEAPLPGGCLETGPAASLTAPDAHRVSRLAELVRSKNIPLSLFWQSSNPANPESSHAFGTCAARTILAVSDPPRSLRHTRKSRAT